MREGLMQPPSRWANGVPGGRSSGRTARRGLARCAKLPNASFFMGGLRRMGWCTGAGGSSAGRCRLSLAARDVSASYTDRTPRTTDGACLTIDHGGLIRDSGMDVDRTAVRTAACARQLAACPGLSWGTALNASPPVRSGRARRRRCCAMSPHCPGVAECLLRSAPRLPPRGFAFLGRLMVSHPWMHRNSVCRQTSAATAQARAGRHPATSAPGPPRFPHLRRGDR